EIKKNYTPQEMKFTADRVLLERVLSIKAENDGFNSKKDFAAKWEFMKRATLAAVYKSRLIVPQINVTDSEVKELYDKELPGLKLRNKQIKPNQKKIDTSFPAMKDQLTSRLFREKFRKAKMDWEAEILKTNHF